MNNKTGQSAFLLGSGEASVAWLFFVFLLISWLQIDNQLKANRRNGRQIFARHMVEKGEIEIMKVEYFSVFQNSLLGILKGFIPENDYGPHRIFSTVKIAGELKLITIHLVKA